MNHRPTGHQARWRRSAAYAPRFQIPGGARAVAILWIIDGVLALLAMGFLGILWASRPYVGIGLGAGTAICATGFAILSGKSKGLLASGIVSIVLGSIVLLPALYLGWNVRHLKDVGVAIVVLGTTLGGSLLAAGILACRTHRDYKALHARRR